MTKYGFFLVGASFGALFGGCASPSDAPQDLPSNAALADTRDGVDASVPGDATGNADATGDPGGPAADAAPAAICAVGATFAEDPFQVFGGDLEAHAGRQIFVRVYDGSDALVAEDAAVIDEDGGFYLPFYGIAAEAQRAAMFIDADASGACAPDLAWERGRKFADIPIITLNLGGTDAPSAAACDDFADAPVTVGEVSVTLAGAGFESFIGASFADADVVVLVNRVGGALRGTAVSLDAEGGFTSQVTLPIGGDYAIDYEMISDRQACAQNGEVRNVWRRSLCDLQSDEVVTVDLGDPFTELACHEPFNAFIPAPPP